MLNPVPVHPASRSHLRPYPRSICQSGGYILASMKVLKLAVVPGRARNPPRMGVVWEIVREGDGETVCTASRRLGSVVARGTVSGEE